MQRLFFISYFVLFQFESNAQENSYTTSDTLQSQRLLTIINFNRDQTNASFGGGIIFLFWIFAVPYDIPFQRSRRESPLEILRKRFASGQVTKEEYHDRKKILEGDLAKR